MRSKIYDVLDSGVIEGAGIEGFRDRPREPGHDAVKAATALLCARESEVFREG